MRNQSQNTPSRFIFQWRFNNLMSYHPCPHHQSYNVINVFLEMFYAGGTPCCPAWSFFRLSTSATIFKVINAPK